MTVSAGGVAGGGLRTGVVVGNAMGELLVSGIVELAQVAERSGYDVLLVPESWGTESFSLVTALGLSTTTLRVGTAILPIANRSPGLVAQGACTVDDAIGNGRLVVGLGMGHKAIAEGWHGITTYDPKLSWMRSYVGRVRSALAGEPTPGGFTLAYPPHPQIPIYLAALRAGGIKLAGELADGVLLYLIPFARLPETVATVRAGAAAAGRAADACEICLSLSVCVAEDEAAVSAARAAARATHAFSVSLPFYKDMLADCGFAADAEAAAAAWDVARAAAAPGETPDPGLATAAITDALIDATFVIGSAEHCRERIAAARAAGVDRAIVYPFGPYSGREQNLAGFARTIEACAGA
jgi:alkanesulfonate monooxygenase SsuD/methylene tetrahydromethanopterin reductase-like flavin-dependent oxidoreductase (luciferase family)